MRTESSKSGRVMSFIGTSVGAMLGAVLGVCSGFFLLEPFAMLTNPQLLKDGQAAMLLRTTIPYGFGVGALIGAVGGFFLSKQRSKSL